jgi:hypothetical protein
MPGHLAAVAFRKPNLDQRDRSGFHRGSGSADTRKLGLRCPVSDYSVEGNGHVNQVDIGADFLLAFSPTGEDPGDKLFKT